MGTRAPRGILLFLGPDRAQKRERIREIAQALSVTDLDRHELDASQSTAESFLALCRQSPAMSSVRLIVMDRADRLSTAAVSGLLEHTSIIAKTACVVLLVEKELSVRHALATASREEGWTVVRFADHAKTPFKPFALTDALGEADFSRCIAAVREQLLQGREPVEVIGLMAWQFQRWMIVRRLMDARMPASQIAQSAGLRAWQVERIQKELSKRSLQDLREALKRCWRLDVDVKQGRVLPWVAIEEVLAAWCFGPGIGPRPAAAGPLVGVPRTRDRDVAPRGA